jgi:ABC-2 type transport system permease protein
VTARRPSGARRSWLRLRGLVRKESLQIVRDPSSILIAFVLPAILLLLFGFGISLDAKRVPVALVIEAPSEEAFSFAGSFMSSEYFAPRIVRDMRTAEAALSDGEVDAILRLRANFADTIWSPQGSPIQLVVNGTDSNTARIISGYADGAWRKWLELASIGKGRALVQPLTVDQRVWFNPEVRSRDYLVPGLIAIIMTLIGALLTALVVAREWERGTMEALIVTPVRVSEMLLGKLIPYFVLGMGGMALSTAMAIWLFGVPFRGSFLVLAGASALFMLVALGMGLLISTLARNQFVAGQVAIIVTFLPAFILSGFIFDINSMPAFVQALTHVVAARYFVSILQTLFLAGTVWSVVLSNAAALALMAVFFLGLTWRKTHKKLD